MTTQKSKTVDDLLKAASNLDYDEIKACLDDGVGPNGYKVYRRSGKFDHSTGSLNEIVRAAMWDSSADKDAEKCLRLLHERGAYLNSYTEYRHANGTTDYYCPLDEMYRFPYIDDGAKKNAHNVLKYLLTHGAQTWLQVRFEGRLLSQDREKLEEQEKRVINVLKHSKVMTEAEFKRFKRIGEGYLFAQELKVDVDPNDPNFFSVCEKMIQNKQKIREIQKKRSDLQTSTSLWQFDLTDRRNALCQRGENPTIDTLGDVRNLREFAQSLLNQADQREKEINRRLAVLANKEKSIISNVLSTQSKSLRPRLEQGQNDGIPPKCEHKTKIKEV